MDINRKLSLFVPSLIITLSAFTLIVYKLVSGSIENSILSEAVSVSIFNVSTFYLQFLLIHKILVLSLVTIWFLYLNPRLEGNIAYKVIKYGFSITLIVLFTLCNVFMGSKETGGVEVWLAFIDIFIIWVLAAFLGAAYLAPTARKLNLKIELGGSLILTLIFIIGGSLAMGDSLRDLILYSAAGLCIGLAYFLLAGALPVASVLIKAVKFSLGLIGILSLLYVLFYVLLLNLDGAEVMKIVLVDLALCFIGTLGAEYFKFRVIK